MIKNKLNLLILSFMIVWINWDNWILKNGKKVKIGNSYWVLDMIWTLHFSWCRCRFVLLSTIFPQMHRCPELFGFSLHITLCCFRFTFLLNSLLQNSHWIAGTSGFWKKHTDKTSERECFTNIGRETWLKQKFDIYNWYFEHKSKVQFCSIKFVLGFLINTLYTIILYCI